MRKKKRMKRFKMNNGGNHSKKYRKRKESLVIKFNKKTSGQLSKRQQHQLRANLQREMNYKA